METLATRQTYGCYAQGTNVIMVVGDKQCQMDYNTAFQLSAFLRHAAHEAKKAAGDFGIRITGVATLTDANADELKAQLSHDGTAVFSGRSTLT